MGSSFILIVTRQMAVLACALAVLACNFGTFVSFAYSVRTLELVSQFHPVWVFRMLVYLVKLCVSSSK